LVFGAAILVNEIEFKDCRVEWFGLDAIYFSQPKSPKFYRTLSRAFRFTRSSGIVPATLLYLLYYIFSKKRTFVYGFAGLSCSVSWTFCSGQ